jgi:hypothetical protein
MRKVTFLCLFLFGCDFIFSNSTKKDDAPQEVTTKTEDKTKETPREDTTNTPKEGACVEHKKFVDEQYCDISIEGRTSISGRSIAGDNKKTGGTQKRTCTISYCGTEKKMSCASWGSCLPY